MLRKTILIAAWCVLAGGCATVADRKIVAAAPTQAAAELDCMSDCLGDAELSCEDCATRCFAPPTGVLLSFSR